MKTIKKLLKYFSALIGVLLLYHLSYITFDVMAEHHFDLITVNSIFAGFQFTGVSLILSMNSSKTIAILERIEAMDEIYSEIFWGIKFNTLSIACSLFVIFFEQKFQDISEYIMLLELVFLIQAIILFAFSIKDLSIIIKHVRKDSKK